MKYLKKIVKIITIPIKLFQHISLLKTQEYKATFELEGNIKLNLPKSGFLSILTKSGRNQIFKAFMFTDRPQAEPLLRKIVYGLFLSRYLNCEKSIIDIGCWIGDNSLVWAKMLKNGGSVYAIEGIYESFRFASKMASINEINNVHFTNAICADVPNLSVVSGGSQGGTYFKQSDLKSRFKTTTIDEVIPLDCHGNIGLFHIDVEGFEEKVILGAMRVIKSSRPIIIFEQHISSENARIIINLLESMKYKIFMVNEVIPGNRIDCRNFIAFDATKPLPNVANNDNSKGSENNIWYATLGPSLLEIES